MKPSRLRWNMTVDRRDQLVLELYSGEAAVSVKMSLEDARHLATTLANQGNGWCQDHWRVEQFSSPAQTALTLYRSSWGIIRITTIELTAAESCQFSIDMFRRITQTFAHLNSLSGSALETAGRGAIRLIPPDRA